MSKIQDRILIYNDQDKVRPCPEVENVREFRDLWSRITKMKGDADGRKKKMSQLEFAYIFHMCSYKSPYAKVPKWDRHDVIVKDMMPEQWVPDELVQLALQKYEQLVMTPALKLVVSGQEAINNLAYFLENANFDPEKIIEVNGEEEFAPVAKVGDVLAALSKIGDLSESLAQLRTQLAKEEDTGNTVRRGVEKTKYNDPSFMK